MHALARLPEFLDDSDYLLALASRAEDGDLKADAEFDALNKRFVKKYKVSVGVFWGTRENLLRMPIANCSGKAKVRRDKWLHRSLDSEAIRAVNIVLPGERPCEEETLSDDPGYDDLYSDDLWNGKYLVVRIDLTRKKEDILNGLKQYIDLYDRNMLIGTQRRIRENELDCWKIYDYHKKDGLSFAEITRKLWPTRGINTKTKKQDLLLLHSEHEKVRNSYKKAKNIIDQVKKESGINTQ